MKIANLQRGITLDSEQRKKAYVRKEMDHAYKKTAKFVDPSKNPMLQALENLLSGKTDKELYEADASQPKETIHFLNEASLSERIGTTEWNDVTNDSEAEASTVLATDYKETTTEVSDEIIEVLEEVKQAAFASQQPTAQDLRVAASAQAQIQTVRGEAVDLGEESAPFAEEDLTFDVPERFLSEIQRDANAPTIFGKDLEQLLFTRTFNKAKQKYTSHIEMVKNNYRSYNEPLFTRTA